MLSFIQRLNVWKDRFSGRDPYILSLLVKDTEGELLSFHQEVKRFQKEWTCWRSTNRCSRVCFDSHTWQESLSVILALKSLSRNICLLHKRICPFFFYLKQMIRLSLVGWYIGCSLSYLCSAHHLNLDGCVSFSLLSER